MSAVTPDWLFIGVYPNAFIYADKRRETRGDYHQIGAVYFSPLSFKIWDDSPEYADMVRAIKKEYRKIRNNINEPIIVSATGQTTKATL